MNDWYAPALERSLRKSIQGELRLSKATWKEYRRNRTRWWRRTDRNASAALSMLWVFGAMIWGVFHRGIAVLPYLVGLYVTASILLRVAQLDTLLYRSIERAVMMQFPVSDRAYFDHVWRGAVRRATIIPVASFVFFGAYALSFKMSLLRAGVTLALALLLWAGSLAAITHLQRWNKYVVKGFWVATFLFFLILVSPPEMVESIARTALISPAEMCAFGFRDFIHLGGWMWLFWCVPMALLAFALPTGLKRLRESYPAQALAMPANGVIVLGDPDDEGKGEVLDLTRSEEDAATDDPSNDAGLDPETEDVAAQSARVKAVLESRSFLQPIAWKEQALLERIFGKWINDREEIVAQFMMGDTPGWWSKQWIFAAKVMLAGLLTVALAPWRWAAVPYLPLIVALVSCVPIFGGVWPGLTLCIASTKVSHLFSTYPLDYWEISRVIFKGNSIRILSFFLLGSPYLALLSFRLGETWQQGVGTATMGTCALIAVLPITVALRIAAGTNDSKQFNWTSALVFLTAIGFVLFTLFLLIAMGANHFTYLNFVGIPTIAAGSTAVWAIYGWSYRRGSMDQVTDPPQQ